MSACSAGVPRPAATSGAPTSLRSSPAARDSPRSRGLRTCTAEECPRSSASTVDLQWTAPGDRCAGPACHLELAGKQLDVGAARGEQARLAAMGAGGELEVQYAGLAVSTPDPARTRLRADAPDGRNCPGKANAVDSLIQPDPRRWRPC